MKRKLIISSLVIGVSSLSLLALVSAGGQESEMVSADQKVIENVDLNQAVCMVTNLETLVSPAVSTIPEAAEEPPIAESWSEEERYLLAKIAMAEAESEDTEGKALVIRVVLNRVQSWKFPDSIEEVLYQKNQFSPISNGRFDRVEPSEDCWKALEMVELQQWDESRGALYFESESASTWHQDNLKYLFQHGNHLFYTEWGE